MSEQRNRRVQYVYNALMQRGLSPIAAAAVTGHLIEESGYFDPNVISGRRRGDGGSAGYVAQWRNDRLQGLYEFARANNRPLDLDTQLDYIFHEATTGSDRGAQRALNELQSARTLEEATAAFAHFERPQDYTARNPYGIRTFGRRLGHARNVLQMFGAEPGVSGAVGSRPDAPTLAALGYGAAPATGDYSRGAVQPPRGATVAAQGIYNAYGVPPVDGIENTDVLGEAYGLAFENDPFLEGSF